jgi:hypothetical protein
MDARRELLLHNDYAGVLAKQMARWQKGTAAESAAGGAAGQSP